MESDSESNSGTTEADISDEGMCNGQESSPLAKRCRVEAELDVFSSCYIFDIYNRHFSGH